MRIDKLELGVEFKNMKVMCEELEVEYKDSTNSRKAIIKDIEQYVRLEKNGRRFTVVEVFGEVVEKEDGRGLNPNSRNAIVVYADHIDRLMLDHISRRKRVSHNTRGNLACICGVVNNNYKILKDSKNDFNRYIAKAMGIHNTTVSNQVNYNIKQAINLIDESVQRLARKGYIESEYDYTIKVNTSLIPKDEQMKEDLEVDTLVRMADKTELKALYIIEEEVLGEFSATSFSRLTDEQKTKYFKRFYELANKKYPYIMQVWKGYKITKVAVSDKHILDNDARQQDVKELSELIIDKIITKLESDVGNAEDKVEDMEGFGDKEGRLETYERHQLDSTYLLDSSRILDVVVKHDATIINITDMKKFIRNK